MSGQDDIVQPMIAASEPAAIAYDEEAVALSARAPTPTLAASYGPDAAHLLEIYAPPGARNRPVLLFFHGGAWISGHLGWARFMANPAMAHGFVFATATYRLAPRCRWPAQLDDVTATFRHVEGIVQSLGGDPGRIAVGGHSAGGHLASLLALRNPDLPIRACLPVSSSFDLRYGDIPEDSGAGRVYKYLLSERSHDADASPVAFVHADAPPFHIVWGEKDLDRVSESGARMHDALAGAGVPVTADVRPGASHFDTHLALADARDAWYDRLEELTR